MTRRDGTPSRAEKKYDLQRERDEARAENERLRQQAVINDPEGAWDRETARLNAEIERLERAVVSAVEARNQCATEVERLRAILIRSDADSREEARAEVERLRPTLDDPEAPAHFPTLMRERDEARAALDRVRAVHVNDEGDGIVQTFCVHDGREWPCPTIAALDDKKESDD